MILSVLLLSSAVNAVLNGFEPELLSSSANETGNLWTCFGPLYQEETVEELTNSVFGCAKRNLYLNLMKNVESRCVDIGDGVTFVAETDEILSPREVFPSGEEPATFRGVIGAYSSFLSRRAARWDLGFLYPGLVMRIGPTMNGNGILEFSLEKRLDYNDRTNLRPGQLLVRRTILPRLLGFRMNINSLLPVVLGVVLFVTKNAIIFSKLALLLSTLLALRSLFAMQQMKPAMETYDVVETGSVSQSGVVGLRPRPHLPYANNILDVFAANSPPFTGVNDKYDDGGRGGRNFAWERRT